MGCHYVSSHSKRYWGRGHKVKASENPRFIRRSTTKYLVGWGMTPEYSRPLTSSWKAGRVPDSTISNLPSNARVWGRSFLPLENHRGFIVLNKTEKKASTENTEFKGITTLFIEDIKGPRYIKEPCLWICLQVQGVSEVCLNTNRILGQHPVRRDGSQTQTVGNRLKKKKST